MNDANSGAMQEEGPLAGSLVGWGGRGLPILTTELGGDIPASVLSVWVNQISRLSIPSDATIPQARAAFEA